MEESAPTALDSYVAAKQPFPPAASLLNEPDSCNFPQSNFRRGNTTNAKFVRFLNMSLNEMIPFDGEPVALGTPTFEGEEGKEFWRILLSF